MATRVTGVATGITGTMAGRITGMVTGITGTTETGETTMGEATTTTGGRATKRVATRGGPGPARDAQTDPSRSRLHSLGE